MSCRGPEQDILNTVLLSSLYVLLCLNVCSNVLLIVALRVSYIREERQQQDLNTKAVAKDESNGTPLDTINISKGSRNKIPFCAYK